MSAYTIQDIICSLSKKRACKYKKGKQCLDLGRSLDEYDNGKTGYGYNTCTYRLWHTWIGIYLIRRGGSASIWGTTLAILRATHEYILCRIGRCFLLPTGQVKNGYALTLLAPFLLAWYAFFSGVIVITAIIMTPLYPIAALWSVLFELPASVLNNDLAKKIK
jgi:hypothetical protein